MKQFIWVALGWFSLTLGIIGIVVPVWPTTVFVLFAACCFGRGSERFHTWLVTHPRFGPMITKYHTVGVPPRTKALIITVITISIGTTGYFLETEVIRYGLLAVWGISSAIILRLPYRSDVSIHMLD